MLSPATLMARRSYNVRIPSLYRKEDTLLTRGTPLVSIRLTVAFAYGAQPHNAPQAFLVVH